jgi:hypothetical protein
MYLFDEIIMLREDAEALKLHEKAMRENLEANGAQIGGFAKDRKNVRRMVVRVALSLSGLLQAYSRKLNDLEMLRAVRCSLSDLRRAPDDVLITRCKLIKKNVLKYKKALKAFGFKE